MQPSLETTGGKSPFLVGWPRLLPFKGRATQLDTLHRTLKSPGGKAAIIPARSEQPDGIGKTQLAVEYAYRYRSYYPGGIYWINAGASWTREVARLADLVGLSPVRLDTPEPDYGLAAAFRDYLLEQGGEVLLILHDVENPRDVLQREISPKLKLTALNARLLLVTRQRDLPAGFAPIEVGVLPPDEACALLDAPDPDLLCKTLDYLPLALGWAAAALKKHPGVDLITGVTGETLPPVARMFNWVWDHLDKNARDVSVLAAAYGTHIPLARLRLLSGLPDDEFDGSVRDLLDVRLFESVAHETIRLHPLSCEALRRKVPDYAAALAACVPHLVEAYRNPQILDFQANKRGFLALIEDLRDTRLALPETNPSLNWLERLFTWEVPHSKTNLILHIRERAHHQGDESLRDECDQWLAGSTHLRGGNQWRFPLDPAPLRSFHGHAGPALNAAMLPDGQRAISAFDDPVLRLWNIETGEMQRTFEGHTEAVYGVAVLPDGWRALSASDDMTLRLWNLATGDTIRVLEGHTGSVRCVAILPDGQHALSAAWDNTLRLWDLATGDTVRILEGHTRPINGVAILAGGQQALSASLDRTLRLWDLTTGDTVRVLQGHSGLVLSVAVLPGDQAAISASNDGTLRLWDLTTGETQRIFEGHTGSVSGVAILPGGRYALSASADRTLRLWTIETGETRRVLRGHQGPANGVLVLPDGQRALSVSEDGTLRLWDVMMTETGFVSQGQTWSIRSMALLPDKNHLLTASADGTLRLWDISAATSVPIPRKLTEPILSVAILPDGKRALSALSDGALSLWDIQTGNVQRILQGHTMGVLSLVTLPDGRRALSASYDSTIRLWDLDTGTSLRTLRGHQGAVNDVALLPDGRRALSASADDTIRLWSIETGETLRTMRGHSGPVRCVVVLPDGRQALSAGYDGVLRLWNLENGQTRHYLSGHNGPVRGVAALPNGQRALSVAADGTLRLWALDTGKALSVLHIPEDPVILAVIDDQRVVVGDRTDRIRVMQIIPG
jgi:WD40 repeat protein